MRRLLVLFVPALGALACAPPGDALEEGAAPLNAVVSGYLEGESEPQLRVGVAAAIARQVEQERIRCQVFGGAFTTGPLEVSCRSVWDLEGWAARQWECNGTQEVSCAGRRPSGLVAWPQPDSTGLMGWNGYCGETAAAHVLTNLCDMSLTPTEVHERGYLDVTPGSAPWTMANLLNDAGCGHWEVASGCPSSDQELAAWVTESYFMPVLVEGDTATDYHWTTLYSIIATPESCSVGQLDDGMSGWSLCDDVLSGWRLEGQRWDQELVRRLAGLEPCTRIRLVEPPAVMRPGVADGSYRW